MRVLVLATADTRRRHSGEASMRGADRLIAALEPRASTPSSACPAGRPCRSTTRCTTRRSATCSCATRRAPATPPRATRRRPGASASRSSPAARGDEPPHRRSPTPTWTRCRRCSSRAGAEPPARHDGLPGMRRARHDAPDRQALDRRRGARPRRARDPRGLPRGAHGPPGPVLVDVPADAAKGLARGTPARRPRCPATARATCRNGGQLRQAAAAIAARAGRCSTRAAASCTPRRPAELTALARRFALPVTTTLMALGAFPASTRCGWGCSACTAPARRTGRWTRPT